MRSWWWLASKLWNELPKRQNPNIRFSGWKQMGVYDATKSKVYTLPSFQTLVPVKAFVKPDQVCILKWVSMAKESSLQKQTLEGSKGIITNQVQKVFIKGGKLTSTSSAMTTGIQPAIRDIFSCTPQPAPVKARQNIDCAISTKGKITGGAVGWKGSTSESSTFKAAVESIVCETD